jgi:putative transposase
MIIRKAYKFQLKPKASHLIKLNQFSGCCRFVWNEILGLQNQHKAMNLKLLSKTEMLNFLPGLKKDDKTAFLKQAHSQILQQKIIDLHIAIQNSFRKKSDPARKEFPVFKKKKDSVHSFRYPQGFKILGNAIYLPKIGNIGFRQSRKIIGTPKQVTVIKEHGKWFIAIQVECVVPEPVHKSNKVVGIDVGVKYFATLSSGEQIDPADALKKYADKLAYNQRKLANKKKFSKNWFKQKNKINKIHYKIKNVRADYIHKTTNSISKNHAVVFVENLNIKDMTKSAKGTLDKPGKNIKQKSGLNKSILDQGWFEFKCQLDYKLNWLGGKLISVPAENTSRTCSRCGYVDKNNRRSQSEFKCKRCGYTANADINASLNILAVGQTVKACGDIALANP